MPFFPPKAPRNPDDKTIIDSQFASCFFPVSLFITLDVHGAVERLPALPLDGTTNEAEAATGTDDAVSKLAPMLAPTADNCSHSRQLSTIGRADADCEGDTTPPAANAFVVKKNEPLSTADADSGQWAMTGSNRRLPPCKGGKSHFQAIAA